MDIYIISVVCCYLLNFTCSVFFSDQLESVPAILCCCQFLPLYNSPWGSGDVRRRVWWGPPASQALSLAVKCAPIQILTPQPPRAVCWTHFKLIAAFSIHRSLVSWCRYVLTPISIFSSDNHPSPLSLLSLPGSFLLTKVCQRSSWMFKKDKWSQRQFLASFLF